MVYYCCLDNAPCVRVAGPLFPWLIRAWQLGLLLVCESAGDWKIENSKIEISNGEGRGTTAALRQRAVFGAQRRRFVCPVPESYNALCSERERVSTGALLAHAVFRGVLLI